MIPSLRFRLLKFLMRMLGIGSVALFMGCPTKYGAPEDVALMNVEGSVVSQDSAKAIAGIEVDVVNSFGSATSLSNVNGWFYMDAEIYMYDYKLNLSFKDIDGENNGSFQTLDTTLQITYGDIKAGEKKNIHVQMKRN